ncbi:MAG: Ig-like domain-containing protein, partial [Oscillospiraceae bacterium]|nr:Ig-like domain-containing protein [Oscillospiraceae bacterium]
MKTLLTKMQKSAIALSVAVCLVLQLAAISFTVQASTPGYFSELEKAAIRDAILDAIDNIDNQCDLSSFNLTFGDLSSPSDIEAYNACKDELNSIWLDVSHSYPELFYFEGCGIATAYSGMGSTLKASIPYLAMKYYDLTPQEIASQKLEFEQALALALAALPPVTSELDKVIAVHEYLAYNVKYDFQAYINGINQASYDKSVHNVYGALVNKYAVCSGFAKAFLLMMRQLEVDCKYVSGNRTGSGYGGSAGHAWNLVKVDNNWYHVDVSSDAQSYNKTSGTFISGLLGWVKHDYLLRSDAAMTTHTWDAGEYPAATDTTFDGMFNINPRIDTSQLIYNPDNGEWLYVRSPIGDYFVPVRTNLYSLDISTKQSTLIKANMATWNNVGQVYSGRQTCLAEYNGQLYYNSINAIYRMDFDGSNCVEVVSYPLFELPNGIREFEIINHILRYKISGTGQGSDGIYEIDLRTYVSEITLNKTSTSIVVGATETLTATVEPSTAVNPTLSWASSDINVATVDSDGEITAIGNGVATITASSTDGTGISASCEVTVWTPVSGILLNKTSLPLQVGDTETLTADITPSTATNNALNWVSSDTNIATVNSNGQVVAVGTGNATITATATDGSEVNASCTVIVTTPTNLTTIIFTTSDPSGILSQAEVTAQLVAAGITSAAEPFMAGFDNTVTSIGSNAFKNRTGLSGITLPNNLTAIGSGA